MNFLFGIYVVLALINGALLFKRGNWIVIIISMIFLLYLCYVGDFSYSYDISNYINLYYQPFLTQDDNFTLYYLFYLLMILGHTLNLNFVDWWLSMNIIAFIVLIIAFKVHKINPHYFMFYFMAYFFLNFYTGLKFYYGFCLYFLAFGYIYKPGMRNTILYTLFCTLAGGIHMMYYLFLPLVLFKLFNQVLIEKQWVVKTLFLVSVIISAFLKYTGTAKNLFSSLETETDKIQDYLELETNLGFFIPVFFHILIILLSYKMYKATIDNDDNESYMICLPIWQNSLCQVLFYPLYMLALTFARLTTVSSIILLSYQGLEQLQFSKSQRNIFFCISILMILAYYYRQFVMGSLWEINVLPLFSLK